MIQRKDFIFFEEENCFRIIRSKVNSINMRKFISGMLSCMTLENAKKLLEYIEYVDKYEFK